MIDWNILSPSYLTAVAEWAGAAVTVLAIGPGPAKDSQGPREP
jgi:hypothetical protein